ncbi:hypothetical protein [Luteimonas terricola]|uniref:hypothetical protein n=1 Tax=Luteimonas terricola TaxID=645597 RepID=UPI00104889FF|nr:hypothetical protein [Luteimonas terricola]
MLLYAAAGVLAMWLLAPRVPYADGWRHLARFLGESFPRDVLVSDNGHHEVLPNIVRVLDLRLFDAGQGLQVLAGIVLALATLLVYWHLIRGFASAQARLAGLLAVVLGLFWLGNVRALGHGNESVHAYFVTLFLAIGLHALVRGRGLAGGAGAAALCGLAATFSFGSGIACYAGFAAVLWLRRGGWRQWAVLSAGLLVSLLLLQLGGGSGDGARLAPLQQLPMLLAWLAGPLLYAAWPLLDPDVAAQLPAAAARVPAQALAEGYRSAFGPALAAPWPQALAGLLGLAWFGLLAGRAWRTRSLAMYAGIGTACFAIAVGAMIVLVRLDYFQAHPGQLLAPRYVVWSSLFWAGLLLATAAGARHGRRALAGTVLVALLLLPSQAWMAVLGAKARTVAEQSAMAAAVGVVEPDLALGETVFDELARALPVAREAGVAVFAWPEARWLGRQLPADAPRLPAPGAQEVAVVANRLGADGRRLRLVTDAPCRRLLLVDGDGTVSGLAMRLRPGAQEWTGWMRGAGGVPSPAVACAPRR